MSEYETFNEWYINRYKENYHATDQEIVEWSVFMGYPVSPMEIAELKASLWMMLEREGSTREPGPWVPIKEEQ